MLSDEEKKYLDILPFDVDFEGKKYYPKGLRDENNDGKSETNDKRD